MKRPHLLLAAHNAVEMKENLKGILDAAAIAVIETEIAANVKGLLDLGNNHFSFACSLKPAEWRQRISRLYYAAYNATRAIRFAVEGVYNTDVSDHKKVDDLPDDFPNINKYVNSLKRLRDDRCLCDYDHTGKETDLIIPLQDAHALVKDLLNDTRTYLNNRGFSC